MPSATSTSTHTATPTPSPTPTATPTATPTPTPTPTPTFTPTASPTATPTRHPDVSIERRSLGDGWDVLWQRTMHYELRLPETWRDFEPRLERTSALEKAESISPCYAALLESLLSSDTSVVFSLLAFDEALKVPDQVAIPAALAVGHATAPAPLPISLLKAEFRRQMNGIPGVSVVDTVNRPKIDNMGAVQQILDIDGLCDATGQPVPATGFQVYLAAGVDITILTFLVPDTDYQDYLVQFDAIAGSFARTE
jgi:hypothetical protein